MEKKYEKENVEDGVVRIDSVQHVVHYAGVGMGRQMNPKTRTLITDSLRIMTLRM